jgi:CP family cyanate transporter-like MFS transporter
MAQGGGYVVAAAGPLAMGLLRALTGNWTAPLLFLLAAAAAQLLVGLGAARDRLVRHAHAVS